MKAAGVAPGSNARSAAWKPSIGAGFGRSTSGLLSRGSQVRILPGASRSRSRTTVSDDRYGRPDGHQPREVEDVLVPQADTAVGDTSGQQLRVVGPVDPDEAAAGPIGEHGRTAARPERDRAVEGVVEVRQLVADVEVATRRR